MHRVLFKVFGIGALVLAAAFLCTVVYVYRFGAQHTAIPTATAAQQPRCAVVFGAAVWPGGAPSDALRDRIEGAVALYEDGIVHCLVLSGAPSAYNAHEAEVMRDVALARDVPLEDMYFDYTGMSTLATLSHLATSTPYVLVSNDFHLARISLLARTLGIEHFALFAAPYQHGRYIKETEFVIREAVALWYYELVFRF